MQLRQQPEVLKTLHAICLTQVTNSFYRDLGQRIYIYYDNLCQAVLGWVCFQDSPQKVLLLLGLQGTWGFSMPQQ
jgi:hypothetical protein